MSKIFIEDEPHPILSLMSMKSLEEMLPASRFIRVHRSFIVQPEKIKVIERNRIVFGKDISRSPTTTNRGLSNFWRNGHSISIDNGQLTLLK